MEPLEFYIIFVRILVPFCGLILSLMNLQYELKRTKELKNTCANLGWEFSKKGKKAQLNNLLHFYLFALGSAKKINNLIYSKTNELNTAIFDYQTQISGSKTIATVVYFRSPQLDLPNFNLLRKPYLPGNTFSDREVTLSLNAEFSEKYALLSDDEAAVRALFSDRLIDYLAQKKALNIEGSGDRLVIYAANGMVKAERIEAFLEEGKRILELFHESSKQNNLIA